MAASSSNDARNKGFGGRRARPIAHRSRGSDAFQGKVWVQKVAFVEEACGGCAINRSLSEVSGSQRANSEAEDDRSSVSNSICGDSVVSSGCESAKRAVVQPRVQSHGDDRSRGRSSKYNAEPEVDNAGFSAGIGGQEAV